MKLRRVAALCLAAAGIGVPLSGAEAPAGAAAESSPPVFLRGGESGGPTATAAFEEIRMQLDAFNKVVAGLQAATHENSLALEKNAQELGHVKEGVQQLRESLKSLPVPSAELDPQVAIRGKGIEKVLERLDGVEQRLATGEGATASGSDEARLGMIFAGTAALLALASVVSVVLLRPGAGLTRAAASLERRLAEVKEPLAAVAAGGASGAGKGGADAAGALQSAIAELRNAARSATQERGIVETLVQRLETLGADLQPAADSLAARVRESEATVAALAAERASLEEKREQLKASLAAEAGASGAAAREAEKLREAEARLARFDRLWPDAFNAPGPLAAWKDRLAAAVAAGEGDAATLYAALVRWHAVRSASQRDRDLWLDATDAVGRACHAYFGRDTPASDAEALERIQTWTRAFKTPLEEAFPSLKLNAVYPGDRFDSDRMEAVGSSPGGRQTVTRPLSWFVLEKTADATRILRRALVNTA